MSSSKKGPKQAAITVASLVILALLYYFNGSLVSTDSPASPPKGSTQSSGHGDKIQDSRMNDGDSFWIDHADGSSTQYRLYYADAPESAMKSYRDGDTNHHRVRQQAQYFGISDKQAVQTGKDAKKYVQQLLETHAFEVHSTGERVYNGARRYAFVEVEFESGPRWLHELLIERGLARIHTKPAKLPDGTSTQQQKKRLKELERKARSEGKGAWKY